MRSTRFDQPPYLTDRKTGYVMSGDSCFVGETVSRIQASWPRVSNWSVAPELPSLPGNPPGDRLNFLSIQTKVRSKKEWWKLEGGKIFVLHNKKTSKQQVELFNQRKCLGVFEIVKKKCTVRPGRGWMAALDSLLRSFSDFQRGERSRVRVLIRLFLGRRASRSSLASLRRAEKVERGFSPVRLSHC